MNYILVEWPTSQKYVRWGRPYSYHAEGTSQDYYVREDVYQLGEILHIEDFEDIMNDRVNSDN